ncbi:hypothetical protein OIE62_41060 (plasmid) [Streptomyces scopuliridis]|uniref:Uncharacterized protein n=1 Tax=Streptomyces scopuliridis TaxID=452529 RepID=A0ACD4ZYP6_9ACTN|nr:hypothetical protein OG835_42435 [Streptomyces scopuliridis]WSC11422.1 hypothetical protein OIE62_41060 [Streptomyces scopuliridis]
MPAPGIKAMPTPRWHRFLHDTFGDDAKGEETSHFLHPLLGYSVTGDAGAQVLPSMPDLSARHTPATEPYHGGGASTRDRAHHTRPGPRLAGHNEKGLQP